MEEKGIVACDCCPGLPPEPHFMGYVYQWWTPTAVVLQQPHASAASAASSMLRAQWVPGQRWSTLPIYITRCRACCRGTTVGGQQAAGLNNPFLLHAVQSGLQGVKAKVPLPQFLHNHGGETPHYESRGNTRICFSPGL